MALSLAFQERLEQMDRTRNERLSLLQAEKKLQASKSKVLASKLEDIRSMEQRCLLLDQKIAFQNFKVLALKSQIEALDSQYHSKLEELRGLRIDVEELEEVEKEKDECYELKRVEMEEFTQNVEKFVLECQERVEKLTNKVNESKALNLQGNFGHTSNSEIAAAEMRKSKLLAVKENLDRTLASNYEIKLQLQIQLENTCPMEKQEAASFRFADN